MTELHKVDISKNKISDIKKFPIVVQIPNINVGYFENKHVAEKTFLNSELFIRIWHSIFSLVYYQLSAAQVDTKSTKLGTDIRYLNTQIYHLPTAHNIANPRFHIQIVEKYCELKLISKFPQFVSYSLNENQD